MKRDLLNDELDAIRDMAKSTTSIHHYNLLARRQIYLMGIVPHDDLVKHLDQMDASRELNISCSPSPFPATN